jgi:hypothetical protein
LAELPASNAFELSIAACLVADAAVRWRCKGADSIYTLWRDAIGAGVSLVGAELEMVSPFLDHAFGLPSKPRDEVHRRGWLAEFLWFSLAGHVGTTASRSLVRIEGPDWHATKPGRDGLAIWRTTDGDLEFRLWEMKQYTGSRSNGVGAAVGAATSQLKESALEYLAEATSIAAAAGAESGEEVRQLYGNLVGLWVGGSPKAGVGISVATSEAQVPKSCFSRVQSAFPRLSSPGQIEGLIAAFADFPAFADDVRNRVWTPL